MAQQEAKTWIPVDVKLHWFSFLSAKDLANASRVCRSWVSLTQKAADAMITQTIAAAPPPLARGAKLKFLHRLQNATDKENMGYLLSWAAGCRGELQHRCIRHRCLIAHFASTLSRTR
jgi:hypothetical protein